MTQDDGIFREVDEAVRNDKLKEIWEKAGRYIVWLTGAVLLVTIIYVGWMGYVNSQKEQKTLSFYEAVMLAENGDSDEAMKIFKELSISGDASFETLSKMWIIKLLEKKGKSEDVRELAEEFSKDTIMPKHYREWFHLYLNGDHHEGDLISDGSIYGFTELEEKALYLIKKNKLAQAAKIYQDIASESNVPASMRQRAEIILKNYLPAPAKANAALVDKKAEAEKITAPLKESVAP